MYIRNGQLFNINTHHVIDDVQYPPLWFAEAQHREQHDIMLAYHTEPPAAGPGQKAAVSGYEPDANGVMCSVWKLVDLGPDEAAEIAAARERAITRVWGQIKAQRDGARSEGGVLVDEHWFHTDSASRIKWLGLKDSARDLYAAGSAMDDVIVIDGDPVYWKTMSGAFVPATLQRALDVVAATKALDKRLFKNAEQHYTQLQSAPDPEKYDYSTGWPDQFADLT